ncbi:hypothetical protein PSAB6_50202 [Paraburkholderia sabiae]|nr:hypothetical protein PSAB6_50202 [Paraburkholderia sabiae]
MRFKKAEHSLFDLVAQALVRLTTCYAGRTARQFELKIDLTLPVGKAFALNVATRHFCNP